MTSDFKEFIKKIINSVMQKMALNFNSYHNNNSFNIFDAEP